MKHLNFLSKSSSQSCGHNVVTSCTTVGSPSVHRRSTMLRLLSVLVLVLTFGVGQMWGADEVYKTATFTGSSFSANSQAYTGNFNSTTNGFTVAITNANNNNKAWNYIKIGGKGGAYTGTITTSAAIDKAITKVDLTIDAMSYSSNVTSIKLYSSSNNSSWTEEGTFTKAVGTQSVTINSPTASKYYKIEVVCTKASGNGCIQLSEVKYYKAQAVPSYTIIAQTNNNTWGTVALSETTITATPADCYQVKSGTAGYTVTAGTASVSHTGTSNTMTVTPSTNCTIQVNFEKKIVNTYVDEIQGNDDIEDCGTHDAPSLDDKTPATTGTCAEQHYHFMGWVTAANKANPTDANIITAGTEMTANGTTYYAVWAKSSAGSCATVTFKTNNSDSSTDISSNFTAQVDASSGMSSYSGSKVYSGSYGLKVGTGSAVGTVTCTLSSAITTKTITVDAKKYGSNNTNISVKVNGSTNFGSAQAIPATGDVLTFSLAANADPIAVSSVTVSTASKQGYIKTITVGEAATYSDYITTCCTELGSINGSFS